MPYRHLLVSSDGSDRSQRAVLEAARLAAVLAARLTVLHVQRSPVMPIPGMGERLDPSALERLTLAAREESERILARAQALSAAAGIEAQPERLEGESPHRAIVEACGRLGCDLIVMASHGRRGLRGMLLGSETQRVLVQADVPVLVVR
ncbi:MAG: universal stress protein [Cyanobacteriota bacterium]|nr:universal stress protein [Cyanobacteriota bacterium]